MINVRCRTAYDGMSVLLPMKFTGVNAKFVIDTGAAVTIISSRIFDQIPSHDRPKLRKPEKITKLEVANDGFLDVDGIAKFVFKVCGDYYEWDMYVAPLREDGLLGLDFLYEHNYSLGREQGMKLNGKCVHCEVQGVSPQVIRVMLKSDTVVPAASQFVLQGTADTGEFSSSYGLVGPITGKELCEGLVIGNTLIDPRRSDVSLPVRVINPTAENIVLRQGKTIGYLHEVDDVCTLFNSESEETHLPVYSVNSTVPKSCVSQWPDPLKDLFEKSRANLSDSDQERLSLLLNKHVTLFAKSPDDLGHTSVVQHCIDTGDARPIKHAPRRPPRAFIEEERRIIDSQLATGVIRESTSAWASPMVYVRKKDGSTRPCVDYRSLNYSCLKDAYPIPRIDDCLDCLGGAHLFSTLDLQSGYWQIEVREEDKHKTAFTTRHGLFEYNFMPFGLCNAPSTFERCMEIVMRGLQWKSLLVYLDDIIIFSSTVSEHFQRLDEVFCRLKQAGLKLKPSKCELLQEEVNFLGHVVTQNGVMPDASKVEAVRNWPVPRTVTDVRSFLGLCSYYRRFVPHFSARASPMNSLLEAGKEFVWTDNCQAAFEDLKSALTGDEVMAYPSDTGLYILDTDASDSGIGATLSQVQWCEKSQREEERPIAYASRSLTKAQRTTCNSDICPTVSPLSARKTISCED